MPVQYNYGTLDQLGQNGIADLMRQAQADQAQSVVQNSALQTQKLSRDKLQADMQQERSTRQLSMLASLGNIDPAKRPTLYKSMLPTLQQLDPTNVLPAEYADETVQFAKNAVLGPKGLADLDIAQQRADESAAYREAMLGFKQQQLDAGPKAPSGYAFAPDGTLAPIPGGPGDPANKPMNEYQGKSALFASRMAQAEPLLEQFKDTNTLAKKAAASVPLVGNFLAGDDYQQLDQAKRNFLNAVLRQESGAAIGQSEFDNAERQYFPQPGDGPDVIEQKRQNRALAAAQMAKAAGPGYVPPPLPKTPAKAAVSASAAPAVGTVEDGHRFLGGNPADPNSWEKVN